MKKVLLLLLVVLGVVSQTYASGFQVLLQGNRQLAMGNLGVALQPSASSIFWNPAALGFMDNSEIQIGFNLVDSEHGYAATDERDLNGNPVYSSYKTNTENPFGTPVHAYAVWAPEGSKFRFGLGFYTPFGSTVKWEEGWKGSDLLKEMTLKTYYFQPTVAYRINDKLSIGGGLVIAKGTVNLQRTISQVSSDSYFEIDGASDLAYGYNIGLFYKMSDKMDLAINYRSKVLLDIKGGDAMFNVPSLATPKFSATKFDGELPMPSTLSVGLAIRPSDRLTLSTEFSVVGWSTYEELPLKFNEGVGMAKPAENASEEALMAYEGSKGQTSPRKYENTFLFKIGGEYKVNDQLFLRAGIYYDETPVQDGFMTAETPGQDRINFTGGIGWAPTANWQVDVSFLYVNGIQREQTHADLEKVGNSTRSFPVGTFKSTGYIGGMTVSYKF